MTARYREPGTALRTNRPISPIARTPSGSRPAAAWNTCTCRSQTCSSHAIPASARRAGSAAADRAERGVRARHVRSSREELLTTDGMSATGRSAKVGWSKSGESTRPSRCRCSPCQGRTSPRFTGASAYFSLWFGLRAQCRSVARGAGASRITSDPGGPAGQRLVRTLVPVAFGGPNGSVDRRGIVRCDQRTPRSVCSRTDGKGPGSTYLRTGGR